VTSPAAVLVTRDDTGQALKVEWFETEQHYYREDPLAALTFDIGHSVWWGKSFRPTGSTLGLLVAVTLRKLTEDPWADVSQLSTHFVSEPGAPLEPIVERAA
jgi:hypothetical protein